MENMRICLGFYGARVAEDCAFVNIYNTPMKKCQKQICEKFIYFTQKHEKNYIIL